MKFYVYYYLSEDGLPYYVGKGCGRRVTARHLYVVVPPKERIRFLIKDTTEEWALYKEASFIDKWGLQIDGTGTLENICDKPHPTNNKPHPEERRERIRESNIRFWEGKNREVWNKGVVGYTTSWKGGTHTEETKERLRQIRVGGKPTHTEPHTEESKELMRNNHPGCRSVIIDGIPYRSVSEASRQLGVSRKVARDLANK